MPTTCQICGRVIKANTGRIAHHGYRQPWAQSGDHARTTSCPGSRHLPYEVSRDAIPAVRANYINQRSATEGRISKWISSPPAELHLVRKDAYGRVRAEVTVAWPEGFNAEANYRRGSYTFMTYEMEHASRLRTMRHVLAALTEAIAFLTERYDNWRAAA